MDDLAIWANYLNGNSPTPTTPTKEEQTAGEGRPPAATAEAQEEAYRKKKVATPLHQRTLSKKLKPGVIPVPACKTPKQKPPPAGQILPRELVLVPAQQIKIVVPRGCDIVFIREK